MDRRNRDEAVQAAHSRFHKFTATARTLAASPSSPPASQHVPFFCFKKKRNRPLKLGKPWGN